MIEAYLGATRDEPQPSQRGDGVTALLEAAGLRAGYGNVEIVRGARPAASHAGEVVALLGPNGAGKTTTLSTLSGELRAARRRRPTARLRRHATRCTSGPARAWRSSPRSAPCSWT